MLTYFSIPFGKLRCGFLFLVKEVLRPLVEGKQSMQCVNTFVMYATFRNQTIATIIQHMTMFASVTLDTTCMPYVCV